MIFYDVFVWFGSRCHVLFLCCFGACVTLPIGLEWWQLLKWNIEESQDNDMLGLLGTNGPESLHKLLAKLYARFNNFPVVEDEKNCFEPVAKQLSFYLWAGQECGFLSIACNRSKNEKYSRDLQGSGTKIISSVLDWPYDCGLYFVELRDLKYKDKSLDEQTRHYVSNFKGIEKLDMQELEVEADEAEEGIFVGNYNESDEDVLHRMESDETNMSHIGSVMAHGAPAPDLPRRVHFVRGNSELNSVRQEAAP